MTEVLNPETGELIEVDEDAIAAAMTPDDGEPEPDQEPEPEPEPEPRNGPGEREVEQAFKKVEQSTATYAKRIGELLGFMADDLTPCVLCAGTPHLGFLNLHAAGTMPQDMKDAVMTYLGYAREQDYEPAPNIEACRICKGKGKVRTGSAVPGKETTVCVNCVGYGYYPPPSVGGQPTPPPAPPFGDTDVPSQQAPIADTDVWGDPRILPDGRENPNYGRMPQYKQRIEPWGVTAGLTAQDAPS